MGGKLIIRLTTHKGLQGYTLIELLIAMGIAALIIVGVGLVLQSQERAYQAQGSAAESLRSLDAVVQQLQQDLRMAGSGLPHGTLPAIVPGNAGEQGPLITVRYLTDDPFVTTLTADASEDAKLFHISPNATRYFRRGDHVLIHRDGRWVAFRVAAVESGDQPGLRPDRTVLGPPEGIPTRLSFPRGSQVIRLRDAEVQYLVEERGSRHLRLIRRQGGKGALVAPGLQQVRFDYLVARPGDDPVAKQWTSEPPTGEPVLGIRVFLAVGQTSVRFTVTPRNLLPASLSKT